MVTEDNLITVVVMETKRSCLHGKTKNSFEEKEKRMISGEKEQAVKNRENILTKRRLDTDTRNSTMF